VKRRRGRPRLDPAGPSIDVHVRLGPRQYDQVYTQARRQRSSVAALIRHALTRGDLENIRDTK
jgi:hypothetical protein